MSNYRIGTFDAVDLAKEFGTPIFIYDASRIIRQYEKLCQVFSSVDHRVHYACKANEAPEILMLLKDLGAGVDTVSPNEIKRALKIGYQPKDIIFTPSCPGVSELEFALDQGIRIHLGGLEYIEMHGELWRGKEIGIRVNPAVGIEGNQKISTAHANSKFGIPLDQLGKLKALIEHYGIHLKTLHIHTGSDVKSWKDLARSFDVLLHLLDKFDSVDTLDIGSGFKVKYSNSDNQVDLEAYADYIRDKLNTVPRPIKIILEPGKYLVAESGCLLTRVNIVKQGYARRFVGINSGFHHLIRPMYYDAYHHIVNVSNMEGEVQLYDVVGQLCEEDTFAHDIPLAEVRPGDFLLLENAGAYAYAMTMTYNLRDKPSEIWLKDGKARVISAERLEC